ncbi:MAG: helix-turn-helix transcriptional regulator [Clostridiaceae bacterium]
MDLPALTSREGAAELLGISPESLRDYERGVTKTVPADIVLKMSHIYNAPEIRNYYCRSVCPIGEKYTPKIDVDQVEIDRLTLRLLNAFRNISSIKDTLVEIVADGIIDESERPALSEVLDTLDAISVHAQELRVWVEKHLR